MAKFTPGPWKKSGLPVGRGSFSITGPAGVGSIATVTKGRSGCAYSSPMTVGEAEANAYLIAAAPELYAALKDARDQIRALCSDDDVPKSVNAALAKAVQP